MGRQTISDYFYGIGEQLIKSGRGSWPVKTIVDKNGKERKVRVNPADIEKEKRETTRQAVKRAKSTEDKDIIANILAGSKAAQSDLYAKYKADAFKIIHTFVQDKERAEDLVADAFVKVFTKMGDYAKVSDTLAFKSWFVRVCSNTARDYLRSAEHAFKQNEISEEAKDLHFNSMSGGLNPEEETQRQEVAQAVHAALEKIPMEYRSTIKAFYFEGLSVKEIAEKEGISTSGVTQRLARGKQALKGLLSQDLFKAVEPHFTLRENEEQIDL